MVKVNRSRGYLGGAKRPRSLQDNFKTLRQLSTGRLNYRVQVTNRRVNNILKELMEQMIPLMVTVSRDVTIETNVPLSQDFELNVAALKSLTVALKFTNVQMAITLFPKLDEAINSLLLSISIRIDPIPLSPRKKENMALYVLAISHHYRDLTLHNGIFHAEIQSAE